MSLKKIITGILLLSMAYHLTGCYVTKNLTHHDLEFENKKNYVDSYTKNYGLNQKDKIVSYIRKDGEEIIVATMPEKQRINLMYVSDDTLFVKIQSKTNPELMRYQKIPIDEIQSLKIKRYNATLTWILVALGSNMFLSLLGI